jgi:hypothetical protein
MGAIPSNELEGAPPANPLLPVTEREGQSQ